VKRKRYNSQSAYLFILPYFLLLLLFFLLPAGLILPISFTNWSIVGSPKWVGLGNYIHIFKNNYFWKALGNTLYYTVMVTVCLTFLGMFLATLLNQKLKGRTIGRMFVFMPYVISSAAAGIVFRWIYDQNFGIIASYLHKLGLPSIPFLTDPRLAMISIILMNLWWSVGFNTIIYLAALQGIPEELYQAAEVDGASSTQIFYFITLPLLKPITLYVTVLCFANSFQMFDEAYIMTQGGPLGSTTTLVLQMWNTAFSNFHFGEAAAISMIIMAIIMIVTLLQFRLGRQKEEG